jgi:hypothetical protein
MSSVRFSLHHWVLGSVVILAAACATTSSTSTEKIHASSEPQRFSMVGSGLQTTALITKDGAQGPDVNVGRFDNGGTFRGTVSRGTLQINVSGNRATGQWGNVPLNLEVEETADQLKMNGLIAGRPSTWTASANAVQGNIGFCSYDLARQGDSYVGTRSCGRGIGQVTVSFPTSIHEWEPINIGLLMALLMATP